MFEPRQNQTGDVPRQQQLDAADGARQVEVDRPLLLHAWHEVRGGEDRQERAEEIEEARKAGLEPQDELLDADRAAVHLHLLAEELRAGERSLHDVEVHGEGKDDDEDRGENEVRDQRPAGRGLAHDVFDVGCQDFHGLPPAPSVR